MTQSLPSLRGSSIPSACACWLLLFASQLCCAADVDRETVPRLADPLAVPAAAPALGNILPPFNFDASLEAESIATAERYVVRDIAFRGNTVLGQGELEAVRARYGGRALSFRELQALRDDVTALYVDRGYLTSGAVVRLGGEGDLLVELTEGRLDDIEVESAGRYQPDYIADYLRGFGPLDPVNVLEIEERLQILQRDPHVEHIEAQLLPGTRPGESVLRVRPHEVSPWYFSFESNNQQSPAVGTVQGLATLQFRNLAGRSDDLLFSWREAEGLTELAAQYELPVNARDTRLAAYAFGADSEIVTRPFDDLDIEAETRTYGIQLTQPLSRALDLDSTLTFNAEWRRSNTYLLGSGFSFVEGPDEGEATVSVLRLGWQRLQRLERNVLASRLQLSVGVDAFGATQHGGDVADGQFAALLAQLQWARRLDLFSSQLIARLDIQWTEDPLLGIEQISLGGRSTVRGYRENTLIRDQAFVTSVEWRIPLFGSDGGAGRLELRPFFDWSRSWNVEREEIGPGTLRSAGAGLFWSPVDALEMEVYWGYALNSIDYPGEDDLQDDGIHLRLRWETL